MSSQRYVLVILDIDVAELPTSPPNAIIQIPRVLSVGSPVQVNEVILRGSLGQNIHAVLGILHLPNPPDSVDHAMMEPEDWVSW